MSSITVIISYAGRRTALRQRPNDSKMEKTQREAEERCSAGLFESRAVTKIVGRQEAQADVGTLDEDTEKDDHRQPSKSAETSRLLSPGGAVRTEFTMGSTSLCESQDVTSVAPLNVSNGRGRRLSPTSLAERRRQGLRTFWRVHKNTLLYAFFIVLIIGCLTATEMGRRLAVSPQKAVAESSERDQMMDAPAVETVPNLSVSSALMSPAAQTASSDPLAPVPVETEANSDSDVQLNNKEAPWKDAKAFGLTTGHRRQPIAPTSTALQEPFSMRDRDVPGERLNAPLLPGDLLHDPFGSLDRCGLVRYTFCPRLRREVFYDRNGGDCVAVTTAAEHEAVNEVASMAAARYNDTSVHKDLTPLCNSSPNRFSSLESCRESCQRRDVPAERCFDETLFSECRREHVLSTRWYFDGHRRREWHFPGGRCPSVRALRSRAQCARVCAASANWPLKSQESVKDDRCGTAPSQPCKERQLRFLYFADVSSVGSQVRCLKATQATLVGRRCLVGPNRYESLEECRAACVRGGDEGVGQR
ncbi:uncharacterized protein LOC119161812 isoform X1 [Rhipicephalus microplus]|uniref:uncharacterized protein LOC119161812 isoform X1 n=1 Tax=Rhipicephalus microplus TaxID=6941 RepID=UPI003F6AE6A2